MPDITGTLQDASEAVYVGPAEFENLDTPNVGGANITGTNRVGVITESDGALPADFALAGGRYKLWINGRASDEFSVPEDGGPYDLNALMSATEGAFNRRIFSVSNITALRALISSASNFRAEVLSDANGLFAVYRWDADATDADDGNQYIRPSDFDTEGLWVKIL